MSRARITVTRKMRRLRRKPSGLSVFSEFVEVVGESFCTSIDEMFEPLRERARLHPPARPYTQQEAEDEFNLEESLTDEEWAHRKRVLDLYSAGLASFAREAEREWKGRKVT